MSTATATACPPWCSEHLDIDGNPTAAHQRRVEVGNVHVVIQWCPADKINDGQPVVESDQYSWVSGQDARDYAAAIVAACDLIDTAT